MVNQLGPVTRGSTLNSKFLWLVTCYRSLIDMKQEGIINSSDMESLKSGMLPYFDELANEMENDREE